MFLQKIIKSTDTSDIIVFKPSSVLHILLHYSPRCTRYTTPHSTSNNQYLYWTLSSHAYFSVPAGSDHLLGHGNDDDWIGRGVLGWLQRLLHHLHHRHPHDPGPHSNKQKTGIFVTCNLYFRDRPILEFWLVFWELWLPNCRLIATRLLNKSRYQNRSDYSNK